MSCSRSAKRGTSPNPNPTNNGKSPPEKNFGVSLTTGGIAGAVFVPPPSYGVES